MVECSCLTNSTDPGLQHMDHCKLHVSEKEKLADVLVFRNEANQPIGVPEAVVAENDRTYNAYKLHEQGKSWAEVAVELHFDSGRQAMYEVQRYLDEARALISDRTRRDMLQTEVGALDALKSYVWPAAMKGQIPAINAAMNLIITKIKVLKLDEQGDEDELSGPRTVIVPMADGEYLITLEQIANEGSST